jgi:hypothetical protein
MVDGSDSFVNFGLGARRVASLCVFQAEEKSGKRANSLRTLRIKHA